VQIAMALFEDRMGKLWGYELSKKSGVSSGMLYPMLTQMLAER
jgi:PadR family transcriptional regulator PadR